MWSGDGNPCLCRLHLHCKSNPNCCCSNQHFCWWNLHFYRQNLQFFSRQPPLLPGWPETPRAWSKRLNGLQHGHTLAAGFHHHLLGKSSELWFHHVQRHPSIMFFLSIYVPLYPKGIHLFVTHHIASFRKNSYIDINILGWANTYQYHIWQINLHSPAILRYLFGYQGDNRSWTGQAVGLHRTAGGPVGSCPGGWARLATRWVVRSFRSFAGWGSLYHGDWIFPKIYHMGFP